MISYDLYLYNGKVLELDRDKCIDYLSSLNHLNKDDMDKLDDFELEKVFRENYYELLMLYDEVV